MTCQQLMIMPMRLPDLLKPAQYVPMCSSSSAAGAEPLMLLSVPWQA